MYKSLQSQSGYINAFFIYEFRVTHTSKNLKDLKLTDLENEIILIGSKLILFSEYPWSHNNCNFYPYFDENNQVIGTRLVVNEKDDKPLDLLLINKN